MKMHRTSDPRMEYYRHTYRKSRLWFGEPLEDKKIILYCEQGLGDSVQFLRYLPSLQAKGCEVIVHCDASLHPLLPNIGTEGVCLDKDEENLPNHDYHVLSLDLPFLLSIPYPTSLGLFHKWWKGTNLEEYMPQVNGSIPSTPYIDFAEKTELPEGLNIGICWSGNPSHYNDADRSCPLKYFAGLKGRLISLQTEYNPAYTSETDGMVLWGSEINDILDTVRLINAVDVVVTVDTLTMHLAGALNKRTFCLLGNNPDPRWGETSALWYPSVKFCRKKGDWESAFEQVKI